MKFILRVVLNGEMKIGDAEFAWYANCWMQL